MKIPVENKDVKKEIPVRLRRPAWLKLVEMTAVLWGAALASFVSGKYF